MAVVARNLFRKPGLRAGQHILLLGDEFPSDVYAWSRVCKELSLTIVTVPMPDSEAVGQEWNARILEAINDDTALVVMPHVHWQYGIKFEIEKIAERARAVNALVAIDGTQSVSALDFDVQKVKPDMLVCAAYKWLMGPYGMGLAYFGEFFDGGIPLEESWMARQESNLFYKLTEYQENYRPKAYRYNVGEHSHFIQMPMLEVALREKLAWGCESIQAHCQSLWQQPVQKLASLGVRFEPEAERAHHLVGIRLPASTDVMKVQQALEARKVIVAARGQGIRVSPHLYNTAADMNALVDALTDVLTSRRVVSTAMESLGAATSNARIICFFLFHGAVVRLAISMAKKATMATKTTLTIINILRFRFIGEWPKAKVKTGVLLF